MKRLLLLLAILPLGSCSLIFEAADISIRRSKQVSPADRLAGDGFTLNPPQEKIASFYPKYDYPLKGGITLRPTDTLLDGLVYFVTPFSPASAGNTDDALGEWNALVQRKQLHAEVLERSKASFAGRPATRALLRVKRSPDDGHIAAVMVVKRESDYLILCHSYLYGSLWDETRARKFSKEGLAKLMAGTRLTPGS